MSSEMRNLVSKLNFYRNEYYNNDNSLVSDQQYDELFDKLVEMEKKTGVVLSDSPTVTVGYEVVSELNKVKHEYPPMLSLDKTKLYADIVKFLDGKPGLCMAKMDGLTCRITYEGGKLVRAETRGDGVEGEDITHNIKVVKGVPLTLRRKDRVVVDGELIIHKDDFENLKNTCVDSKGKKYKNPRNLAAGSVRQLDSKKCKERLVEFVSWKYVEGSSSNSFTERLDELLSMGFYIAPNIVVPSQTDEKDLEIRTSFVNAECEIKSYPIDGCVFSFDDCTYMENLGYTSHHWRAQMAFKFYDDKYDTTIRDIDWTMGKTGALTPTAVFDTVEIDGTEVSRASLHNLTIMKQLNVRKNCSAKVYKANMIIPQIDSVEDDGVEDFEIPSCCPICGGATRIVKDNDSEILMCVNEDCDGKLLGKLCTFVSKEGMDIDGLSEGKLKWLMEKNYIKRLSDIYVLEQYAEEIKKAPGWGESSVNKLVQSIDKSRIKTAEKFLSALSIPNIGLTSAKTLCEYFNYDFTSILDAFRQQFDWSKIPGFGMKSAEQINSWYNIHSKEMDTLLNFITIETPNTLVETSQIDTPISGKTFCITGTFKDKRSELQQRIEKLGAIFVPSVTKKTDILFCGTSAGSKLNKAKDLGIIIYNEDSTYSLLKEYNV